jgi:hypothetical protein
MTRSGTTIWHEILTSESVSKMPDIKMRLVFIGLLMACDDWGRFPDSPHKLFMSMPAFGVTPDDIRATIEWLDGECIVRYTARLSGGDRTVDVCQFINWEEYQWRLKSRDNAKYPSKDGILEATTNPLAVSRGDRTVTVPQPNEMKGKEIKSTEKNKNIRPTDGKPTGRDATAYYTDEYRSKIDKTYKPTNMDAAQFKNALIHLGYDLDQFKECVNNCLNDPYFRDNKPGAAFFYRHIEKYKKPVTLPGEIKFV